MRYKILTWDTDVTWQYDAACLGVVARTGEDPFFHPETPYLGGRVSRVRQAKAFCSMCKVRRECLQFAVNHDCVGVFGGTTERERARLVREGKVKKTM